VRLKKVATTIASAVTVGMLATACAAGAGAAETPSATTERSTVTFQSWISQPEMEPMIAAFEAAHPEIELYVTYAPPVQEYVNTLQTRLLAGVGPDVFLMVAENRANLIDAGHVLDLSDQDFMSVIPESNINAYSRDGHVYGMALGGWASGIMYNRELLAEVGADTIPDNWDDFLTLLHELQDAGIEPHLHSLYATPHMVHAGVGAINQATGGTVHADIFDGTSTFAETWTPVLEQYMRLFDEGLVSQAAVGISADDMNAEFAAGRVATIINGPWALGSIREQNPDLDFSMAPVPGMNGLPAFAAGTPGIAYAVNANSENIEGALTFLRWLASPEGVESHAINVGEITATSNFTPEVDPAMVPMLAVMGAGNTYFSNGSWPHSQGELNEEAIAQIQRMVMGQATPLEVAQALDARLASVQ